MDAKTGSIEVKVQTTSVSTGDSKRTDNARSRDDHLRSADFFDAAKFPELKFVSRSVRDIKPDGFDVVGDLTIHGVTRETVFHVAPLKPEMKDPWGNLKTGTTATAKVNRQDFGLVWNKTLDGGGYLVGDEVQITLDVELAKVVAPATK